MQTTGSTENDNNRRGERDRSLDSAHAWLEEAARGLGIDPASVHPLTKDLLDLTRDVAHGPSRPAAPLTAFLVGLAAGRALPATDGEGGEDVVAQVRDRIATIDTLLAERAQRTTTQENVSGR